MSHEDGTGRRALLRILAGTAALGVAAPAGAQSPSPGVPPARQLQIAMLVYPDMILLDLVGPQTVFNVLGATVHLVAADLNPVRTDIGIPVTPTTRFDDCPEDLDVLFVPGGLGGSVRAMEDDPTLRFLKSRGESARYVTSVCTGSLVLGAAGLLRGYRATSHWYTRDLLPLMGAASVAERVVVDRNRITGAGVTAGLDFGLVVASMLRSPEDARRIQLVLEYDPHPPFDAGTPEGAGAALTADVLKRRAPALSAATDAAKRAAERLGRG
jgi:putative intracellular protease/amidase